MLASAGAGKTREIIDEAVGRYEAGEAVLILTYTQNNQIELHRRVARRLGAVPNRIHIKGWFTFLLEDLIRPYQLPFFEKRIENINFNESSPHKLPNQKFQIRGRQEYQRDGKLNAKHFLTSSRDQAHTAFLSKLVCRIAEAPETSSQRKAGRKTIKTGYALERLAEIYSAVIIDEVQDLTGWDYVVLEKLSMLAELNITSVGDFRQTIYVTHHDSKKPGTIAEKLETFKQLGFDVENRFVSHRCITPICEFADGIHAALKLPPTKSLVGQVDDQHQGVFAVSREHVEGYIELFKPTILRDRRDVAIELCASREAFNFGEAKGLQFDRTLIIPTPRQQRYISGDEAAFGGMKTDKEINRFYVATTRARLSVAFLSSSDQIRKGMNAWTPAESGPNS